MAFLGYNQPQEGAWETTGKALGQVLESLGNRKAQNLKAQSNQQLLQSLGIRPEVAAPLSRHSDENIFNFLKQYEGFNLGQQAQPAQQQAPNYQVPANAQPIPQGQPNYNANQPNYPQEIAQKQPLSNQLSELLRSLNQNQGVNGIDPQVAAQLLQQQQAGHAPAVAPAAQNIVSKGQAEADRAARTQQLKELHEERKLTREQQIKEQHESKKWYAEMLKSRKDLKHTLSRLNSMEKLNNSGKLNDAIMANIRDALKHGIGGKIGGHFFGIPGIDLTASLLSPESQEFEKLSTDLVKGIKDIYGGRINQFEVETFMKTIPSLLQSPEGRQAVIENIKRFTQDELAVSEAARKIKDANNGVVPANLEIMAQEMVEEQLDETVEIFNNFIHKPVKNKGKGKILGIL